MLFAAVDAERGPASRYRICQFLPWLEAQGVQATFLPYAPEREPGERSAMQTLRRHASACMRRAEQALNAGRFDVLFVQREATLGPPWFEWLVHDLRGVPLVLDIDDAIYLPRRDVPHLRETRYGRWLYSPGKAGRLARSADEIVVASTALEMWARRFTDRVTLLPTTVDGRRFPPRDGAPRAVPTIGWMGTPSAASHLDLVLPALQRLAREVRFAVTLVGAGREIAVPGVAVDSRPWRMDTEVEDLQGIDIGLCPLPDDAWSQAKCGFKPLMYLASGIPQVSSPVGDLARLLPNGECGYFARNDEEWYTALGRLCASPALREQMGRQARARFEAEPSLEMQAASLLAVLRRAHATGGRKSPTMAAAATISGDGVSPARTAASS